MPLGIALLLGLVQGFTEFLPVSSSGHLALLQNLLNFEQYTSAHLAFDIVLHLGSLVAVFVAFWEDIKALIKDLFGWIVDGFQIKNQPGRRLVVLLLIATAPMALAALLEHYVSEMFTRPLLIGFALLITAALLFAADRVEVGKKVARDSKWTDSLVVGMMQLIAIFPGVSRSGATICGGLFRKFDRDFAVRFAFLLSIPAVLGAAVFSLPDMLSQGFSLSELPAYIVGFATSALSGYFAIGLVRMLVRRRSLKLFAFYCTIVGAAAILFSLI